MAEKLEILCATMHQSDFSKYDKMKISGCDVVFANQADRFDYAETEKDGHTVKMLTTATRGVGKNRNYALSLASGELLLFADDDLEYTPNFASEVRRAFSELKKADVIVFGTKYQKNGEIYKIRLPRTERLSRINAMKYGTYAIAIRRKAVLKCGLSFTELFGGGCLYSYGEDSDFLLQCFRSGLRVYSYQSIIATTNKDVSTCFTGYGEKYYYDKGALARHSMGLLALPYMLKMAMKRLDTKLSLKERLSCLFGGYKNFSGLLSFDEWKKARERK